MSKQEIIKRLREHLKGQLRKQGHLDKRDFGFCVKYIMDFMPWISKKEAADIYRKEIVSGERFESGIWEDVKYLCDDDCITVFTANDGTLQIKLSNIRSFANELSKLCRAFGG